MYCALDCVLTAFLCMCYDYAGTCINGTIQYLWIWHQTYTLCLCMLVLYVFECTLQCSLQASVEHVTYIDVYCHA